MMTRPDIVVTIDFDEEALIVIAKNHGPQVIPIPPESAYLVALTAAKAALEEEIDGLALKAPDQTVAIKSFKILEDLG